jgi:hypothetical protein
MSFDQGNHLAVVNSYMNDFYCVGGFTGPSGCDAHAIGMGSGTVLKSGWGTYKIVNNFLEGAGETVNSGGGAGPDTGGSIDTDADIEIRRNHMFKPTQWMPASGDKVTGWPIVKNHLEQKNGQRTLIEGNIIENDWGGYTQYGYLVLLTPKNQNQSGSNICPYCVVTDVTFRYNHGLTGEGAFQITNSPNAKGAFAQAGHSYSLHDNVMENLGYYPCYSCSGPPLIVSEYPGVPQSEILHDVFLNHNTLVQATPSQAKLKVMLSLSGDPISTGNNAYNITFTNNVGDAGTSGTDPAVGGSTDCAYQQSGGANMIDACWKPLTFGGHALVDNKKTTVWPGTNCLSVTDFEDLFMMYNGGDGGNYALTQCLNTGTDGTNPGANLAAVTANTTSVE